MKFDKESIIVIGGCLVLIIIWPLLFPTQYEKPKPTEKDSKTQQIEVTESKTKDSHTSPKTELRAPDSKPAETETEKTPVEKTPVPEEKITPVKQLPEQSLANDLSKVVIDPNNGNIKTIVLKKFFDMDRQGNVNLDKNLSPGALSVTGKKKWQLRNVTCQKKEDETLSIIRTFSVGDSLFDVHQQLKLEPDYTLGYSVDIVNKSSKQIHFDEILINAGGIPPIAQLCGDHARREEHNIDYCISAGKSVMSLAADAKEKKFKPEQDNSVNWVGVSNKYFTCILKPVKPFIDGNLNMRTQRQGIDKKNNPEKYYIVSVAGRIKNVEIAPSQQQTWKFRYYAGPKIMNLLEKFDPDATGIMRLSFFSWFEWISQMLLIGLNYLKSICGSYGLSIIILTVIVRAAFWPITQKANASMRKMQKLQPEMKALREKYANNPQEMNKRVMQLYKDHDVHPLGGCLPIFLQIPVFLALYSTLDGSIQLRHTDFWWMHDLSLPDTIGYIFGIAINPLILAWAILMLVQQLLTPSAADPVQQKMMMIMPVVMLFFLYDLPSGLTLYWTVSQIISIIQLLINRQLTKREEQQQTA